MRTYTRKTNRGLVPQEVMLTAACEVIEKGRKLRQIAKELNICHATLFRFVKKLKSGENPTVGYKSRRFFTETQEKGIANHLMEYARIFFGLTIDEARKLAFQCAVRLKYPNVPSGWVKNGTAGREWIDTFLSRHPRIHIRTQKATAEQSKHNLNEYFSMLFKLLEEYKFLPSKIYHLVDFSVTPILKYRNMASGRVSVSVGRGKPVNMQLAANASGKTVPPMFVLPIADHKPKDEKRGLIVGNDSGQMTAKDFLTYIDHFILHTKPNPSDPVLLLLQNNCQYHIDVNILEKAKENSIILLSYRPYSKDECCNQPLQKIAPKFLRSCRMAQVEWLRAHPGKSVTPYEIPSIVRKVLPTESDIKKSFQKTGVWPFFNPTGEEFVPYAVEDLVYYDLNEPETQPGPSGISRREKTSSDPNCLDSSVSRTCPVDPLRPDQCRFCGQFDNECVNVVDKDKPYITSNKTALALNDLSVELEFNDALPNTVCRVCDRKLQGMFEFVKQVKEAQDTLINLRKDCKEEVEDLVVKTECESPTPDDYEEEVDEDVKDETLDSVSVTETEYTKQTPVIRNKRKSDDNTPKMKKLKVTKDVENKNDLIIDIKEETVEIEEPYEAQYLEFSDTETDVNLSELERARKALVSEITNKETFS